MRVVILDRPGKGGQFRLGEQPVPAPGPGQVAIRVAYGGVNRADLLQLQGRYPLPALTPAIPGMEVSGEVTSCGEGATCFRPGDKVCALLSEGAFAEHVVVPQAHALPVPPSVTLEQAACLPEACFTVWISLVWQARLARAESVLIHGGTSGIGTIAIQIAKLLGARVFTTVRTVEKARLCSMLGADCAIIYPQEDFAAVIREQTEGRGADVILDMVGGDYFNRNLESLAHGGRLAIIAFQKGAKVEANLAPILLKHLSITGSTLRSRPAQEKARLAQELASPVWDAVAQGQIKPVIDTVFPLEDAQKALARMDQGLNIGKILLKM